MAETRNGPSGRDAMVTGMGFCLPGMQAPVFDAAGLWEVASQGRCCTDNGGSYFGRVRLSEQDFAERVPDVPRIFSDNFTDAHRYGLVSMLEACQDAKLDHRSGDLTDAAILVGRGSIDANVDSYTALGSSDIANTELAAATELFLRSALAMTPSDVAFMQSALARSTGPCFTVTSGCTSSSMQIGNARSMIAAGEIELAIITGVDLMSYDMLRNVQRLIQSVLGADSPVESIGMVELPASFESLARPYDRRVGSINHGQGSATIIMESRQHLEQRGARGYGQVLSHATGRDGLAHPLTSDESGLGLVRTTRRCLGDRWTVDQIPYVHGANDGGPADLESGAIRHLYGPAAADLLLTSQEGCFGHNGAPTGALGVALSLLMLDKQAVCPTANCEEPAPNIPFDPVPGTRSRALDFDHALNFNFQVGGVHTAILLGTPDAA